MTQPASSCLNCGAALTGEFCSTCGQKVPRTDLTLRDFLHDTTEQLANWDGKIPQTLKTLLLKPGALTIDFLEGRRARWLLPLRVYLICSVAYFVGKQLVETVTDRSARPVANASLKLTGDNGSTTLSAEDSVEIAQGLPARIFGKDRLLRAAADSEKLGREINAALPKAMFVLLPFFALLTRVAWHNRLPRYPAHLYLALHVHAAWFVALLVNALKTPLWSPLAAVIGLASSVYLVWYALVAMKRVFGESWARTLVKSTLVTVVYGFAFMAVGMALLGYAITRM